MVKLEPKNLPRGTSLRHDQVHDNMDTILSAASDLSLDNDNRQDDRSRFALTWNMTAVTSSVRKRFAIPPLQEWFLDSHEETENTPVVKLESLCFWWDRGGMQNARIDRSTPAAPVWPTLDLSYMYKLGETPDNDAYVRIYQGPGESERVVGEVLLTKAEYNLAADESDFTEVLPKFSAMNITISPYKEYTLEFQAPFDASPVYSVVVKAEFSHPIVERDHAGLAKKDIAIAQAPSNMPLHNNARVLPAHSLPGAPVDGDLILASGVKGIQTAFETVDALAIKGLDCGLDRYSRILKPEDILEDQGMLAITVPMYNFEDPVSNLNVLSYTNGIGEILASSQEDCQIMDRAIIPIRFPMTIHHVLLEFDTDALTVGNWALADRILEVGVGMTWSLGPWGASKYTQVARTGVTPFSLASATGRIGAKGLWSIPISYAGVTNGEGWVPQGGPIFCGLEMGKENAQSPAVAQRSDVADQDNGPALVTPPTNGAEQFIEVRTVLKHSTHSLALNDPALGLYTAFPQGGVNVYIFGKMALVE